MPPRGSGMAAARGILDPDPDAKGDQMDSAVTETKTTVERWRADPSRTTVEFEVEHLWRRPTKLRVNTRLVRSDRR